MSALVGDDTERMDALELILRDTKTCNRGCGKRIFLARSERNKILVLEPEPFEEREVRSRFRVKASRGKLYGFAVSHFDQKVGSPGYPFHDCEPRQEARRG